MTTIRFLSNDSLWSEVKNRAKKAKRVFAAVAYMGSNGAKYLPLKRGDILVVDLSLPTVKSGGTDPKEIRKLINRGVEVFTRNSLHAKFFIMDRLLISGSANISSNSIQNLDEAALLTDDPKAVRLAKLFFNRLCVEPVRPEYLRKCIDAYKPPTFHGGKVPNSKEQSGAKREAKLWFVGGLRYAEVPEAEHAPFQRREAEAESLLKARGTFISSTHYPKAPQYYDIIREGDWMISCVSDSEKPRWVECPQQVLRKTHYSRGNGRNRYIIFAEAPKDSELLPFQKFRKKIRTLLPKLDRENPRTTPIHDVAIADEIMLLWDSNGKIVG